MVQVVPVFKNGDETLFTNYHPIPLTSYCCKLEHAVADCITTLLNNSSLLSNCQHAFDLFFIFPESVRLSFSHSFNVKINLIGLPAFITNEISAYLSHCSQCFYR